MWKFPTYQPNHPINWDELCQRFDWLEEMKTVQQDPIWHGEGDVFTHTQMVVNELIRLEEYQALSEQDQHILFATALLHDVEKRSTTRTEVIKGVERITSPRHAIRGEFTARTVLYRDIPTPFAIREQIAKLVRYHGLPIWALRKRDPRKKVISASLEVNTHHLAIFSKADMLGRICTDVEEKLLDIELFAELCKEHDCYGKARNFSSPFSRFQYLNQKEMAPDYAAYDDLKFDVIMMCALPGSGKDHYIKNNLDAPVLSLDGIRRANNIAPTDKKGNGRVIQMSKEQAKVFMRKKQSFIFNATNISKDMRSKWLSLFNEYSARVKIIYLEVPYQTLIKQNHNRDYKVPLSVIERMIDRLEVPSFGEAVEVVYNV